MKKITFLLALLVTTIGFSQTVLEDFESTPIVLTGFEGLNAANVTANPSVDSDNGSATAGELIVAAAAGQGWQGADLVFQGDALDVTNPVTQTVSVDVYATEPFTLYAEVGSGINGAVKAGADEAHGGTGWETLTFTFNEAANGTGVANGVYGKMSFFPNWNGAGWHVPPLARTIYIDNITGTAAVPPETCNDGIQNQDETGIDCGGSSCAACPGVPLTPTSPANETLGMLNDITDTGSITSFWNPSYYFGENQGVFDYDTGAPVNKGVKMDFSVAGWGGGINDGADVYTDVSSYNFVNFSYFIPTAAAGANGHEFKFILIGGGAGPTGGAGEFAYTLKEAGQGGDGDIVFDTWTSVAVPLTHFTGLGWKTDNFFQFKLGSTSDLNSKVVYFDNMFFSVNAGTLGNEDFDIAGLNAYPNPTSSTWTIKTSNNIIQSVEVFNLLGSRVLIKNNNSTEVSIPSQGLSSGIYIAKVTTDAGTKTMKLLKE